jgi:23S rRNA (cytidine1920-2'-O)/16S rRNA (cytidine1409-2'-O)-methyltransferase
MKLLDYLLEHGMAPDERSARGLIMRGDVLVDDQPVTSPSKSVPIDGEVRIRGNIQQAVSRGYNKLAPVLDQLSLKLEGRRCLDLGVSTGGFSQCLLERGVATLYAVDVAYGTAADLIRNDPRVVLLERTNARELTRELIPDEIDFVTGDLSFIGWQPVMPAVVNLLARSAELLLLVKPQFELASRGRSAELSEGIAISADLQFSALGLLWDTWQNVALCPSSVIPSPLKGQKGNQEYFVHLKNDMAMCTVEDYRQMAAQATGTDL